MRKKIFLACAVASFALMCAACDDDSSENKSGKTDDPATERCSEENCDGLCIDDECIDTNTDPAHCGEQDKRCGKDETCEDGVCTPKAIQCASYEKNCDGSCIDVLSDMDNCGDCGVMCKDAEVCINGSCSIVCPTGLKLLPSGVCVDPETDNEHCGPADMACLGNSFCDSGVCGCPSGFFDCDDDLSNGCESNVVCASKCEEGRKICEAGNCCDESEVCCGKSCCAAGSLCCGENACVDGMSDVKNCGECGIVCASNETCLEGVCSPVEVECVAEDGQMVLACWGQCVDVSGDNNNCGECGHACGENEMCSGGQCEKMEVSDGCDFPTVKCYGSCVDLQNDKENCGACLNKCGANELCINGMCDVDCGELTKCGKTCSDLTTDAENCGACGTVCSVGMVCEESACKCAEGRFDCDGDMMNGCESTDSCACQPGQTRDCWNGDVANLNPSTQKPYGACRLGKQKCDETGRFWGTCEGAVYPSMVTCNDAGLYIGGDQNCNNIDDSQEPCKSSCDMIMGEDSYIGCEYWPVFLQNYSGVTSPVYYDMTLVVSNPSTKDTATIYVFDKPSYTSASHTPYLTFTVAPGAVVYKTIVGDAGGSQTNKQKNGTTIYDYMLKNTMQAPWAFKVRSSIPVVAYQFNPYGKATGYSSDASLMLPQTALGQEYLTMGFTSLSGDSNADVITAVATEPGVTNVTVTVKAATRAGTNKNNSASIAAMAAGSTRTFQLNQFDALSLQQSGTGESTGSYFKADKKIEVFGGAACSNIPIGYGACDHTEEMILPLKAWGTNYAATRTRPQKDEINIYYILAQQDGTQVKLVGPNGDANTNKTINLSARAFTRIDSKNSFDITANRPIYVGQFLVGKGYSGASYGDPSFISLVPREQYRKDYSFSIPSGYSADYVTVIAPTNAVIKYSGAGRNGKAVSTPTELSALGNGIFGGWTTFGNQGYRFAWLDLDGGTHKLESANDVAFGVVGYGFYGYTSYGYAIGMDLKKINNTN